MTQKKIGQHGFPKWVLWVGIGVVVLCLIGSALAVALGGGLFFFLQREEEQSSLIASEREDRQRDRDETSEETEEPIEEVEAPMVEEPVVEEPVTEEPVVEETAVLEPVATLIIWADETRAPILKDLADEALAQYNIEIEVVAFTSIYDIRAQAITAISAGEGPDIFLGTHDWISALVSSGLVSPIDLGAKEHDFVESSITAFTFTDGQIYGLPAVTENMGFFYNTELISEPPTTWGDVLAYGQAYQDENLVEYALSIAGDSGYFAYPIWDAFGGYVFGRDENNILDIQDIGLNKAGNIAALEWVVSAINDGLISGSTDYETAHVMFESGEIPFLMAGPWALDRIRESGISYAVAPFFPDEGRPLLVAQGFFINSFSENFYLSQSFLTEFIASQEVMTQLQDASNLPSAYKSALAVMEDPDLKAMGEAGINAVPIPNVTEMASVWGPWMNGLSLVLSGDLTPQQAMDDAVAEINELFD